MKQSKSGVEEGKGGDSPSRLIDARIEELSDWRALDAPHRRRAARIAERSRAPHAAACQGRGDRSPRPLSEETKERLRAVAKTAK